MPKNVRVELDQAGIAAILQDETIARNVEQAVAPALIAMAQNLYPGSKWSSEIGQTKDRKRVIIKTDTRDVPFREAATGRIRRKLRGKLSYTEKIKPAKRKPKD